MYKTRQTLAALWESLIEGYNHAIASYSTAVIYCIANSIFSV